MARVRGLAAAVAAALVGVAAIVPVAAGGKARSHVRILGRGSWCWFEDPRAVRVVGQYDETVIGWIGWRGAVTIGALSPRVGLIATHVVGYLYHDDHGSPAIFVEPDKRLTVFYSGHNGGHMYYRTTLRPEDITAWGPLHEVHSSLGGNKGFTYPNPVLLPAENNRVFLFWRGSQWGVDYATRTIAGRWSPARHLIAAPGERPYLKVSGDGAGTIAMAFTNGHPRERITSVYYASYRNGALWHADGRRIASLRGAPIRPDAGDVIYNGGASGASSWVWDTAFASDGRPVVVYATFANLANHAYWYAHFDGRRWVSRFITFGGPTISPGTIEREYSGGIALDHAHPGVVYVSRKIGGNWQIQRWTTSNFGASWHHATAVNTPGSDNLRPVVPRGYEGGPLGLLWLHGHYGTYTTYRTRIAYLR